MFSSGLRKESKEKLEKAVSQQKGIADILKSKMEYLYNTRTKLKTSLEDALECINSLKNVPENLNTQVKEIQVKLDRYQNLLDIADAEYKKDKAVSGGTAAGGIAAGIGVAALAPTAAMAVATTFGTAATGTAIASLSGAAATNAALAWLGGGALVAGGAGIAGGESLLALAGPIGWAIGGVALATGGVMASGKNKKAAQQMDQQTLKVVAAADAQKALTIEIKRMTQITEKDNDDIRKRIRVVKASYPDDFSLMNTDQIIMMGTLVNNVHSSAKHLNAVIGEDGKFAQV